jgi:hypothetical protein
LASAHLAGEMQEQRSNAMTGLSSSLHVKGSTPKRVQQAVTELLASEGFQVLNADATDVEGADKLITRGLWIAKAKKGDWVSLFCSDFLFQQEIGRELSRRLGTHTVNVWINEESSWHYTLFHKGEEIDQFDSTGDQGLLEDVYADNEELNDDVGDADGELASGPEDEDDLDDSQLQQGLERITQLHEKLSHKMPEDVRAIVDRLNEGKATLGEMRRFDEWSQEHQTELLSFQNQLQEQTAELSASIQGLFKQEFAGEEGQASEMLKEVLPPDMADAFGKILSGEASYEDLARLADMSALDKLQEDDPLLQGDDDDIAETTFAADDEEEEWEDVEDEGSLAGDMDDEEEDGDFEEDEGRAAFSEEQLQIHLGALRPLLSKDADPDEVAETLTYSDEEMPEQPLGEFLDLLGIDDTLSDLDFDAIDELGDDAMAERGIELSPLLLVRTK